MNVEEIQARADAATPGPWMAGAFNPYRDRATVYQTSEAQKVNPFHWQVRSICREVRSQDADFIEHARTDIPALLDEVARLRAALAAETQDRERVWRECEVMSKQQLAKTREIARLRSALEAIADTDYDDAYDEASIAMYVLARQALEGNDAAL